jgi:hypothetical protein
MSRVRARCSCGVPQQSDKALGSGCMPHSVAGRCAAGWRPCHVCGQQRRLPYRQLAELLVLRPQLCGVPRVAGWWTCMQSMDQKLLRAQPWWVLDWLGTWHNQGRGCGWREGSAQDDVCCYAGRVACSEGEGHCHFAALGNPDQHTQWVCNIMDCSGWQAHRIHDNSIPGLLACSASHACLQ